MINYQSYDDETNSIKSFLFKTYNKILHLNINDFNVLFDSILFEITSADNNFHNKDYKTKRKIIRKILYKELSNEYDMKHQIELNEELTECDDNVELKMFINELINKTNNELNQQQQEIFQLYFIENRNISYILKETNYSKRTIYYNINQIKDCFINVI